MNVQAEQIKVTGASVVPYTITHTTKDKIWTDEAGIQIPLNRITKAEKLKERNVAKLLKEFQAYHEQGVRLKELAVKLCQETYESDMRDKGVKPSKENKGYTFHCFNRTVKVERSVKGNPSYDEATMQAAKSMFDEYIDDNIQGAENFITDMMLQAFEGKNGQFDKNRIQKLISYKNRSKNKTFIDACELLSTAARYTNKSVYYRVWLKDAEGKYQNIDVQFSNL